MFTTLHALSASRACHSDFRMTQLIGFPLTEKEVLIKGLQLTKEGALSCGLPMYSGISFFLGCLR